MKFPLYSKASKKAAVQNMTRLERERAVASNKHVKLLTVNRGVLPRAQEDRAKESMELRRKQLRMRRKWVLCLLDNLKEEHFFEGRSLKWEEIEEAFTKRRQTWMKCTRAQWLTDEKREVWWTDKGGKRRKKVRLVTGPSYDITDHFIHDVTTAMEAEGFTIRTREFVDVVAQGLDVMEDPETFFMSDPSNPAWKEVPAGERVEKYKEAREQYEGGGEVWYLNYTAEDVDWLDRFPLVGFGTDDETVMEHADRAELWCLEFEAMKFEDETSGRVTQRVLRRGELAKEKKSREKKRKEDLEELFDAKAKAAEGIELPETRDEVVDVFQSEDGPENVLELITLKQPLVAAMLDDNGEFTVSVTVKYKNVGTEENPIWVKGPSRVNMSGFD